MIISHSIGREDRFNVSFGHFAPFVQPNLIVDFSVFGDLEDGFPLHIRVGNKSHGPDGQVLGNEIQCQMNGFCGLSERGRLIQEFGLEPVGGSFGHALADEIQAIFEDSQGCVFPNTVQESQIQ